MVLAQNEVAADTLAALPGLAHAAGASFWLNAAPAEGLPPHLLKETDGLVVNRLEAGDLLGDATLSPGDLVGGLAALAPGATIIVTLGAEGAAFVEPGGVPATVAARRINVHSTHGAGDMFVGSLAAAVLRGEGIGDAVDFAQGRAADLISTPR
jgi:ribokinase